MLKVLLNGRSDWMKNKQLKLNESKTDCIILGTPSDIKKMNISKIVINDTELEVKTVVENFLEQ